MRQFFALFWPLPIRRSAWGKDLPPDSDCAEFRALKTVPLDSSAHVALDQDWSCDWIQGRCEEHFHGHVHHRSQRGRQLSHL